MSRMRLCLDSPILPEGTVYDEPQPIYDFDFEQAVADGLSLSGADLNKILADNDNVSMCRFEISGVTLNQYLSTNMPRRPWDEGDVLRSRISPYIQDENDVYQPDPQYYNFQLVSETSDPQPAPDDWHDASNYFGRSLETVSGHTYERFYNVRKTDDWTAGSITYYKDVGRNAIKQYYTAAGYSFSVYRGGQGKSSSQAAPLRVAIGSDSMSSSQGTYAAKGYNFTNPANGTLQYYSTTTDQGGSGSKQNVSGYSWSSYSWSTSKQVKVLEGTDPSMDGVNTTLVFISFRYEDPDPDHYQPDIWYYGIAMVDHNNWTERAIPTNISVIAFTSAFWGRSIINGGGGESIWGNDGPPSVPQGGNGNWSAPSDNRGDENGDGVLNISSDWGSYQNTYLNASYNRYHLLTRGAFDSSLAFQEMCAELWNPNFWQGFQNILLSPLDCIITCNMMPHNLCPTIPDVPTMKVIEAGGAELSTHTVPVFNNFIHHYHVGSVNINDISDSFADYTYSSIYIHLPYVGTYKIDTEAVMQGKLAVDYSVDMLTGDVTAFVWTEDFQGNYTYRYTFKGNAAKRIPLNQRVPLSTAIAKAATPVVLAGVGAAAGGVLGSIVGGAVGLGDYAKGYKGAGGLGFPLSGALQSAGDYMPEYLKSGATKGAQTGIGAARNASAALNAGQSVTSANVDGGTVTSPIDSQCYLIIERPIWSAPENYRKLFGYPSDIGGTITEKFHGFLSCRAIKLDGITAATDDEKAEIYQLMASGVYVDDDFGPENE